MWLYDQANYQLANDLLSSVPWESTLPFSDTESAWLMFKHIFLSIMHTAIPSKLVYPSPCFSIPWINGSLLSHIKFRNSLYRSAKRTRSLSLWSYYRYFRNKTLSLLRSFKCRFFQSLPVSPNSHSFWSTVNKIHKKPVSVPTLLFNGISASTPQAKADVLNEYFSSCFNKSCTPLSAIATPSLSPVIPADLLCSTDQVFHLILNISLDTTPGSDGISSHMIHHTAHSITLPLSLIFNSSLSSGIFTSDWKNSYPNLNHPLLLLLTSVPFHYFL